MRHKSLGKLGMPDYGWKIVAAILVFRLLCDVYGAWATIRRNVDQVRHFYFILLMNSLVGLLLARPLLLCQCGCFQSEMGLVDLDAHDTPDGRLQCEIWHSFFEVGEVTRRLKETWPQCKQRISGNTEEESREGLGVPVPDLFKVVDMGMKLEGHGMASDCVDLALSLPLGSALEHIGCSFYDMADWMSTPFRALHAQLQACFTQRSCGGIGIVLKKFTGIPFVSCGNITVCRHYYPVLPALMQMDTQRMCTEDPLPRCPPELDLCLGCN